jgi:hypothetical protein
MEEKMNSIEQQDHNDSESERAADDPELDSTDFAHPAWWRGNDRGVEAACECIASILDGTSTGPFTFGSAKLCEVAERIAALQARAAEAERIREAANALVESAYEGGHYTGVSPHALHTLCELVRPTASPAREPEPTTTETSDAE